jgi:hypothetical protein
MRIGTGRGVVPGTAALFCGAGRQSPHVGWVRLVPGPRGRELRLLPIAKPGRRRAPFATATVNPEPRRKNASPFQGSRVPGFQGSRGVQLRFCGEA